jgi:hypothetical protein
MISVIKSLLKMQELLYQEDKRDSCAKLIGFLKVIIANKKFKLKIKEIKFNSDFSWEITRECL